MMAGTPSPLMVIEPVLPKVKKSSPPGPGGSRGKGHILPELPPLPREEELFSPPREMARKVDMKMLAYKLMAKMPEGGMVVEVDKMAMVLELSKEKLYIICNVLEGLRLMIMRGRNVYEWQGRAKLIPTLVMLREMAAKEDMKGQLVLARKEVTQGYTEGEKGDNAREKPDKLNVVMTSQKLMMMFLILQKSETLNLVEASFIIHGPGLTGAKRRVSLKRLEDICKILSAVELLEEVTVKNGGDQSMAFKYDGPVFPQKAPIDTVEDEEMVEEAVKSIS